VLIDPRVPVRIWPSLPRGRERIAACAAHAWRAGIDALFCSTEQKAIDCAAILSTAIGCSLPAIAEWRKRSVRTGYLPKLEIEQWPMRFLPDPKRACAAGAQRATPRGAS